LRSMRNNSMTWWQEQPYKVKNKSSPTYPFSKNLLKCIYLFKVKR
jgi:hypothetical protein